MKDLTTGKEGKRILSFALPMLFGNIFQQMYNVIDSIIVGKVLGETALAAVGANFPFIFALISFVVGIAIGATVIVAQYYGAKQMDNVKRTIDTLYIFIFIAAIFLTVAGISMSKYVFNLIDLPNEVKPHAIEYFNYYALGFVFFFGFQGTSAVLRGLGDSKTPVYFLIIATVMNIILDLVFVLVLNMGIKGVAIATVIAQGGAFITIIWYLNKYHSFLDFAPHKMKFDRKIFAKSIKIGLPSGFQQTFVAIGSLALYKIVNTFGVPTIAAYTIAMRIDSFAVMPAMNFSAAISTFVGQNIGANKFERISNALKSTLKTVWLIAISVSIVGIIFAEPLLSLFTDSEEVINIGRNYIYIVTPFYVIFSTMFIFNGMLRGAGDTLIPMIVTLLALWGIRLPVSWFLSNEIGSNGIWWGIPIAWFFGMTFSSLYYRTGKWKKKAVVKHT